MEMKYRATSLVAGNRSILSLAEVSQRPLTRCWSHDDILYGSQSIRRGESGLYADTIQCYGLSTNEENLELGQVTYGNLDDHMRPWRSLGYKPAYPI